MKAFAILFDLTSKNFYLRVFKKLSQIKECNMNILPVSIQFKVNTQKQFNNYKKEFIKNNKNILAYYPSNDSVSFGAKTSKQMIEKIGEENFPSPKIFETVKQTSKYDNNFSLYNIHIEYYRNLLNCKTLKEAKKKYPEFEQVIDAKDLDPSKMSYSLKQIKNGKKNIKIEDLSLDLLKKYFSQLIAINKKDEYYGISANGMRNMLEILNFPVYAKQYAIVLYKHNPEFLENASKKSSEYAKNHPEKGKQHSEFMKDFMQRPDVKARMQNRDMGDDFRAHMSEVTRKYNQEHPEKVEKQALALSNYFQNNLDARKNLSEKLSDFNKRHPEYSLLRSYIFTKIFPDYCKKMSEIAKDFPALKNIREKEENGVPLTKAEKKYERNYFARCEKECPNAKAKVGKVLKELIEFFELSKNCDSQQKINEIEAAFNNEEQVKEFIADFRRVNL